MFDKSSRLGRLVMMVHRMCWVAAAVALAGCGGGADQGAALCVEQVKERLGDQIHRLDEAAVGKSKTTDADGLAHYKGEIVLRPGTSQESKQAFDCFVAPGSGNEPPRVQRFDWRIPGSGLTEQ
jgi:hypothetical protein